MRILVTGANGFLGCGVVEKLHQRGHSVVATDYSTDKISTDIEKIDCDLFSVSNPYEYFGRPEVLVHMAWRDGFVHNADTHINDLPKHFEFLELMMGAQIRKIVVMGSMHEVGFYEGSIDENTPCQPMSLYGIGKNALRNFVQAFAEQRGVSYQWLRGYYIVSSSIFGNSIFAKIARAEKEGEIEFPFTMGQNQYDFLNYEDFCIRVAATVSQDEVSGIINICSGVPQKLSERVEGYIKENGFKIRLKYGAFPDRPYDSKAIWGNSRKIEDIMKHDLQ